MQNLKKLFFVALIFTLATVGCKKTDDNVGDDTPSGTCYINKIDFGSDGFSTIIYNSDHLFSSIISHEENGTVDGSTTNLNYDGTKLLTLTSIDYGNVEFKFEYIYGSASTPDSAILWADKGNGTLEKTSVYGLSFSGDKLVKAEMIFEYMGQSIVVSKNEYTYSGDNLSESKTYKLGTTLQFELESAITYEYDSKKNPMHGVGLDFFFMDSDISFMSTNNITKCTVKDASGSIDQSKSYTNAIEYNTNNYPSKSTATNAVRSKTTPSTYVHDL